MIDSLISVDIQLLFSLYLWWIYTSYIYYCDIHWRISHNYSHYDNDVSTKYYTIVYINMRYRYMMTALPADPYLPLLYSNINPLIQGLDPGPMECALLSSRLGHGLLIPVYCMNDTFSIPCAMIQREYNWQK